MTTRWCLRPGSTRRRAAVLALGAILAACSDGGSGDDATPAGAGGWTRGGAELATVEEPSPRWETREWVGRYNPNDHCSSVGADHSDQPTGHSADFWCVFPDGSMQPLDHDEACRGATGVADAYIDVRDPWVPELSECYVDR